LFLPANKYTSGNGNVVIWLGTVAFL